MQKQWVHAALGDLHDYRLSVGRASNKIAKKRRQAAITAGMAGAPTALAIEGNKRKQMKSASKNGSGVLDGRGAGSELVAD